jgi:20S proteasome alpha/beta subunit
MTVVVAFHCSDGAAIASDSMITPTVGGLSVGHHHGIKVYVLPGSQVFAFAGDQGQAARFKLMAEVNHGIIAEMTNPLDYPLTLAKGIYEEFQSTGVGNALQVNTILAYLHRDSCYCCAFEGKMQPRLLDRDHFYVALGSGKLSADPFLRFLVDTFCQPGYPTVREGVFLATWAVQHVIDVNPGGVAGPIRVAVIEKNDAGNYIARELPSTEIDEHQQAVESAREALRDWRGAIGGRPSAPSPSSPQPLPTVPSAR